jgi:hypothetical protein
MNANPWSLPKSRALRRLLLAFDERIAISCELVPDLGSDPDIVTLRHHELDSLRAHVFLHGQRPGTYGLFYEYALSNARERIAKKPPWGALPGAGPA